MTKRKIAVAALMAMALIGISTAVSAADLEARPIYKAPAVEAWNPWMVRLRVLGVIPRDSGYVNGVLNSGLATSDAVVPELDISYFFTRNIAAELILGVTRHHVTGTGSIAGLDVGKSWLLPPTLTLQYHFTDFGAFKPYVGAGVNYTFFFSQRAAGGAVTASHLKDTAAPVVQVGFDYMLTKNLGLNVDVKKLWLRPDWNGTVGGAAVTGRANLDPWLIGTGLTYKF